MLMMAKNDWVTILGETTSQNLDNLEGVLITDENDQQGSYQQ